MLNRDVFAVDPTGRKLPNDGVTTLDRPRTDAEWSVLKYELEQFVVEGEYREGLRRLLSSYLASVDRQVQPACWVSGFYGSGKSHFLRVLSYLWTNPTIDGVSARSLVGLPDDVRDLLKEFDSFLKRDRTVTFAAGGVLRQGRSSSVAQPLLEIILASADLPTQYGPARFAMWLRSDGLWEEFVEALASRGKGPDEVNRNLFVSSAVREALLEVKPGWADSVAEAGRAIQANYQIRDVSDDMVVDTIREVLEGVARDSEYGDRAHLPLTLLVLDEMQQYLGDDVQLLLEMQNLIERLTREFEGRLLVVAAGQSALTANEMLARFQDRFTISVQLQSRDVETVVRQVVLRKDPVHRPELEDALARVSGEIARHLGGTKLAAHPGDQANLVNDYPLLPARRRFMESALRAVDRGAAGQLRSQLRVTLEAVGEVAQQPLGNVVPGDVIFRSKRDDMLNQGVLLHELGDRIMGVRDGSADGDLRARAVELVFLISQLDEGEGLRPNTETLADLMVTDLNAGSATLRARLPTLLEPLVGDLLVLDEGEYRLQSPTDAEWNRAFRERRQAYLINTSEQLQARDDALRTRLDMELSTVKVVQGTTRTPRRYNAHFGENAPQESDQDLTVWIRNGWDTTETLVRTTVAELGMDSAVVTVFIPKTRDQDFKNAIADWRAAAYVMSTMAAPTTEEGIKARDAMQSQERRAREKVEAYASEAVRAAQVLAGGGDVVSTGGSFSSSLSAALSNAAVRKFPQFRQADHSGWSTVFKRAKEGNNDALDAVGHQGPMAGNVVVKAVKTQLQEQFTTGLALLKHFSAAPHGWPREAVLGALGVLVLSEEVSAWDGARRVPFSQLTESMMGKLEFRVESVALTFQQRQQLKLLANKVGVSAAPPDVPASLDALAAAASAAGGPAPAPASPDTARIAQLKGKVGVERDAAVADAVSELVALYETWQAQAQKKEVRLREWEEASRLVTYAAALPAHSHLESQLNAIREQRALLDDPNPLNDVLSGARSALRDRIRELHEQAQSAVDAEAQKLARVAHWDELDSAGQAELKQKHRLTPPAEPSVASDSALLEHLAQHPLALMEQAVPAAAGAGAAAREELVHRFAPKAIPLALPAEIIETREQADAYVERVRTLINGQLDAGRTVSIQG